MKCSKGNLCALRGVLVSSLRPLLRSTRRACSSSSRSATPNRSKSAKPSLFLVWVWVKPFCRHMDQGSSILATALMFGPTARWVARICVEGSTCMVSKDTKRNTDGGVLEGIPLFWVGKKQEPVAMFLGSDSYFKTPRSWK